MNSSFRVRQCFAALACVVAAWALLPMPAFAEMPNIPAAALKRLFASEFIDSQGHRQVLSQWRGKILVINFWATWCAPCRDEMPDFSRLQKKYAARDVQFVGIAIEAREMLAAFSARNTMSYPLLAGGHEAIELSRSLGNTVGGIPHTVILGRHGEPLLSHSGRLPATELEALLDVSSRNDRMDK